MTLNEKLEMLNEMLTKNYISKRTFDMAMTGLFLLENYK